MCCVWPAAAICAAAEKEEETWKKWNGGGARRKGGGKSDMKRGRKKKTDREHMSLMVCFLKHIFLSLSLGTHLHSAQTQASSFFFFFPLPSLSLSVSSPRAIGPSVSRLHHIQSSHCVSLNECVCLWGGGWYSSLDGCVYLCIPLVDSCLFTSFVAPKSLSGVCLTALNSTAFSAMIENSSTWCKNSCTVDGGN